MALAAASWVWLKVAFLGRVLRDVADESLIQTFLEVSQTHMKAGGFHEEVPLLRLFNEMVANEVAQHFRVFKASSASA